MTEQEIRTAIEKKKTEYQKAVETLPWAKVEPITKEIKGLQKQLSELLSEGAKPCPKCGAQPHGMRKPLGKVKGISVTMYVVGCLGCKDTRSYGQSVKEAVEKWNAGEYVKAE